MSGIDEKFVGELKSKINLIDIVGRYCVLTKKGSVNAWACCPLPGHSEKTPSFTVNEPGQFYKCFGCGKSGDVINFIQEVESLNFVEAVKFLADICKMEVPTLNSYNTEQEVKNKQRKERLYNLMRDTAFFYVNNLRSEKADKMLDYLYKRGLDKETINKFGIGASLDFNSLPNYLLKKGYKEQEMIDAGVCQRSDKTGKIFDCEAQRIIIPIINSLNKVIAFGGRILESSGTAKYKNTRETELFNKSKTLFGINNLKQLKNDGTLDYCIMVEGYMDAISLYSAGFKNVVASMGTSLTIQQAKLLKRYVDKVYVSYDGDSAGQKATIRSLDIFAKEGFDIRIIKLIDNLDPDDIIRKKGAETYKNLILEAVPLLDFKFDLIAQDKNMNDIADKRQYVKESLSFISSIADEYLKEELLKKVRDVSKISYESLKRDLENSTITVEQNKEERVIITLPVVDKIIQAERFTLWAMLYKRPYVKNLDDSLFFEDEIYENIYELILDNENIKPSEIYSVITTDGVDTTNDRIEKLNGVLCAGENIKDRPSEEKYYKDCLKTVKKHNLQYEIKTLNNLFMTALDNDKRQEIAEVIEKKTIKLNELNKGDKI